MSFLFFLRTSTDTDEYDSQCDAVLSKAPRTEYMRILIGSGQFGQWPRKRTRSSRPRAAAFRCYPRPRWLTVRRRKTKNTNKERRSWTRLGSTHHVSRTYLMSKIGQSSNVERQRRRRRQQRLTKSQTTGRVNDRTKKIRYKNVQQKQQHCCTK